MHNGISVQLFDFLIFGAAGIAGAFLFDTLRALDFLKKSGCVSSFLKDVIYWLFVTVMVFGVCLKFTDGEIRFYMLVGMLLGALVYFGTLSPYVVWVLGLFFGIIKKALYYILIFPVAFILKLLNKPFFVAVSLGRRGVCLAGEKIIFKFKKYKKFKR